MILSGGLSLKKIDSPSLSSSVARGGTLRAFVHMLDVDRCGVV